MARYIGKQLLSLVPLLFLVSVAAFGMVRLLPGDPAEAYLNSVNAVVTEESLERVRAELGLDQPLPVQYANWLGRVLRGDLGSSYQTKRPVTEELGRGLKYTAQLAAAALAWVLAASALLGVLSAWRANGIVDTAIRIFTFLGAAMPKFWLGFLLVELFALHWGVLPVQGADGWTHLILPSFTLACSYIATYTKLLRNEILELRNKPFVRQARANGLTKGQVLRYHVLPNALTPALATLGLHLGSIMSGSVIVENVFAWPGLGRMCIQAAGVRNYPMLQGYILLMAALFVLANLTCDVFCAVLDPRIRLEGEK